MTSTRRPATSRRSAAPRRRCPASSGCARWPSRPTVAVEPAPQTPRACSSGCGLGAQGRPRLGLDARATRTRPTAGPLPISSAGSPAPALGERARWPRGSGIMYVIYNRKIWAAYSPGWRDYTGADPHTSHIHISLSWNGARAHTSFWTGRPGPPTTASARSSTASPASSPTPKPRTTPCPAGRDAAPTRRQPSLAWLGSTGDDGRPGAASCSASPRPGRSTAPPARPCCATRRRTTCRAPARSTNPPGQASIPRAALRNVPDWTPAAGRRWAAKDGSPDDPPRRAGKAVLRTASGTAPRRPAPQRLLRAADPSGGHRAQVGRRAARNRLGRRRRLEPAPCPPADADPTISAHPVPSLGQ